MTLAKIWRWIFGRDTLRPTVADPPWESQNHIGTQLHYPGDRCWYRP